MRNWKGFGSSKPKSLHMKGRCPTLRRKRPQELAEAPVFLHSLSPPRSEPDLSGEKARILEEIADKRRDFLEMRAEIERSISTVPNQQVRLAMSLHYVDLLTLRQAARLMGGNCTEISLQALISRYIRNLKREGPAIFDSS